MCLYFLTQVSTGVTADPHIHRFFGYRDTKKLFSHGQGTYRSISAGVCRFRHNIPDGTRDGYITTCGCAGSCGTVISKCAPHNRTTLFIPILNSYVIILLTKNSSAAIIIAEQHCSYPISKGVIRHDSFQIPAQLRISLTTCGQPPMDHKYKSEQAMRISCTDFGGQLMRIFNFPPEKERHTIFPSP